MSRNLCGRSALDTRGGRRSRDGGDRRCYGFEGVEPRIGRPAAQCDDRDSPMQTDLRRKADPALRRVITVDVVSDFDLNRRMVDGEFFV